MTEVNHVLSSLTSSVIHWRVILLTRKRAHETDSLLGYTRIIFCFSLIFTTFCSKDNPSFATSLIMFMRQTFTFHCSYSRRRLSVGERSNWLLMFWFLLIISPSIKLIGRKTWMDDTIACQEQCRFLVATTIYKYNLIKYGIVINEKTRHSLIHDLVHAHVSYKPYSWALCSGDNGMIGFLTAHSSSQNHRLCHLATYSVVTAKLHDSQNISVKKPHL